MLVLTRKLGEGITIGDGIRVVIVGIKGQHVRLGIEAPAQPTIYRDEIYARIMDENRRAVEESQHEGALDACVKSGAWLGRRSGS